MIFISLAENAIRLNTTVMRDIKLLDVDFNPDGFWRQPIPCGSCPGPESVALFDQNGYDLTLIEQRYARSNDARYKKHREHIRCLKETWFSQDDRDEGSIINHSNTFERKGYRGEALEQLKTWALSVPLLNKVIALRPKWGLDFSMDYVDRQGNAFEVLHWEYDSFEHDEMAEVKAKVEPRLLAIDWDDAARQILNHKNDWHHLGFFEQSDWKCDYFGIPRERFKMVAWE